MLLVISKRNVFGGMGELKRTFKRIFKLTVIHSDLFKVKYQCFNTLRPRQNERQFADDIFKCIFLSENV